MKIILTSRDKNDLKNDIKRYTNHNIGPITKSGKFYKVVINKK